MGQKVNPNSFRMGLLKPWLSNWMASSKEAYVRHIKQDHDIRAYIRKNYPKELLGDILIHRTLKITTVILQTPRPPLLVGQAGALIEKHTQKLSALCKQAIQIHVQQIRKPELNARIVASTIASKISGRFNYKRAMRQSVANAMRMGAQGVKVKVSGRLGGAEMARSEVVQEGRLPLHTIRAEINYAGEEALTTYGKIGVKVWIFLGEVYGKRDLTLHIESHKPGTSSAKRKGFVAKRRFNR